MNYRPSFSRTCVTILECAGRIGKNTVGFFYRTETDSLHNENKQLNLLDNRKECRGNMVDNISGGRQEVEHPYVGMWVTKDGYIRHELLPGGRYDEARGNRQSAYQGRYVVDEDHIEYVDDTGFTADGNFKDGVLYHAGMVLYREKGQ
jgi:hypothetical protein